MNEKALQKAANVTVLLNTIYTLQNRADIPRAKLREIEPAKKALETELWDLLTNHIVSKDVLSVNVEDTVLIADKVAEAKVKMAAEKKVKKVK